ncbi:RNA 2',3'-cyclic phosphodiesterase [Pseudomonas sp. PS1]|uniref:RNA 2',3'-cyclic phosphodiesterase n=1 Tax=Stutzerimonas marianensis TaxID=2929513 RepID=A0A9X1W5K5_9GAMM|nr:RNA 2',3'-cyclic phosphodiesterase [Pseudomonas marianensis]MCJ0975466.1 RNA 2',3'-cyclic phosphodiesterase [Pseudomonas marianensis]
MNTDKPLRLFFALPCPPPLAGSICRWRDAQGLAGRPVPEANLHLTLAFLGSQPAHTLDALVQLARPLHTDAFVLRLDELHTIGHGFACLVPSQVPPPLSHLVGQLHAKLCAHGVALDSRPFLPHVTLSRETAPGPQPRPPVFEWRVERFGLYLSENVGHGVQYRELSSWPLTAPRG